MEEQKNRRRNIRIGIIISLSILLVIYIIGIIYFKDRFYLGSAVNCISVSGKTLEEANEEISSGIENYTLKIAGRDGINADIKSTDIDLKYISEEKVKEFKETQNPFGWIAAFLIDKESGIPDIVSYNDEALEEIFNNLCYFTNEDIVEPKNASFEYTDSGYIIKDEVYGNKVDKDILHDLVIDAIKNGKTSIDLEASNCYIQPKYTSKSKEAEEVKNKLNEYIKTQITYTIGDKSELVEDSIINTWLAVNDEYEIIFNEDNIQAYVDNLASKYNTIGKTREFNTSTGKTVTVYGGNYGWSIDKAEEVQSLISLVKEGKSLTKEPQYIQTAVSHDSNDIGNTYVEINLTKQHMWLYKDGALVVDGDVVTGDARKNYSTPAGTYRLNYKQRNATLKGQGYSSKVSYWMPFNGGIGIHDASWRNAFGGNRYTYDGSHGCVNAPTNLTKTIYNNIESGTPVICYTE